jgi:hypothetical protein
MSLFRGPRGDISSKRAFGVFCCLMACAMSFLHPDNFQLTASWLAGATSVFITQAITKT